jgi:hemolysin activation/secretion protein
MRVLLRYLALAALTAVSSASAQDPGPYRRPGDERLELPELVEPQKPAFELPPAPAPLPEADRLDPAQERIVVQHFAVEGSTVFSPEQIAALTVPYENRPITFEELVRLRNEITLAYVNAGYQNSGAVIPQQKMEDGVLRMQVVEGRLSRIDIQGTRWFREAYFRERLEASASEPLNVNSVQQRLQLFQQDPRIRQVHAELHPGERPGDAVLEARFEEEVPYRARLEANNYESPSIGSNQVQLGLGHDNPLGFGDRLSTQVSFTEGYQDYFASYEVPVTRWDTTLGASYEYSSSEVIEDPFDAINIESRSQTVALRLRQPLLRDLNTTLDASLSAEWRESKTFLLDEPFSFTEGPDDGVGRETVIRLGLDWVYRDLAQVVAARSLMSTGVDALDATVNEGSVPDGQFFVWLGQFQYLRRTPLWDTQVLFRTDVQLSTSALLSLEQFAVGGHGTVRGYRENYLVRDNGLVSSLELRIPLLADAAGRSFLQLAPFADIGRSWNTNRGEVWPKTLYSAGVGLRWQITQNLEGQVYWADALKDVPAPDDHDLQDSGVQFRLVASY